MADVDPIRKLIWSIGNGTSESSLCETLEFFFHSFCPLADVLDKEICKDYKHAYHARCEPNAHRLAQEGTFLYVGIVLLFCVVLTSFFKAHNILSIPDSAVTIAVGFVTGALFVVSKADHRFNEQVFFEVLLPFIIFEAGYNMDKTLLQRNIGLITCLATVGTVVSFAVTTGLMIAGNDLLGTRLSNLDCAMFGALISSTDPVAIVNVFSALGVDARLYSVVLGESALNDGVAVALYSSIKHFYSEPNIKDFEAFKYAVGSFFLLSFGSLSLGFASALLTAYFWKMKGRFWFVHPVMETLAFLVCAILPYYIADALRWSGIIAVMSSSIFLSIYAHDNLSSVARLHVVFVVECIARLCESVMFGYVGTQIVANNDHMVWTALVLVAFGSVLIARAVAVFPLIGLNNVLCKSEHIPLRNQVVVWFSGLRGALSFALAVTVPEYDTVLQIGSKHTGEILACTCFVIMLNVFVMGSLAPWVLSVLIKEQATSEEEPKNRPSRGIGRLVWIIHSRFLVPCVTTQFEDDYLQTTTSNSPLERGRNDAPYASPDENGFLHVAFDDEDRIVREEASIPHTILFPRSRLAIRSFINRQRSGVSNVSNSESLLSPDESIARNG